MFSFCRTYVKLVPGTRSKWCLCPSMLLLIRVLYVIYILHIQYKKNTSYDVFFCFSKGFQVGSILWTFLLVLFYFFFVCVSFCIFCYCIDYCSILSVVSYCWEYSIEYQRLVLVVILHYCCYDHCSFAPNGNNRFNHLIACIDCLFEASALRISFIGDSFIHSSQSK